MVVSERRKKCKQVYYRIIHAWTDFIIAHDCEPTQIFVQVPVNPSIYKIFNSDKAIAPSECITNAKGIVSTDDIYNSVLMVLLSETKRSRLHVITN